MARQLRRDMLLNHSLRESSFPIEVMARDTSRGNLCSVDGAAIRLWGPNRQLKAHHIAPESKEAILRPLCVFYVGKYDRYIIVWSIKKKRKDDEDDRVEQTERGGLIQVWDSALLLQQEVPIMHLPLKQYALCLERLQFILIDVEQTCILMQIDHLLLKKAGKAHYQGGKGRKSSNGNGERDNASIISDENLQLRLYFNEIQRLPMASDEERVVDAVFINNGDSVFVLTHCAINCYSALVRYPQGESMMSTSIFEAEMAPSPPGTAPLVFDDGDNLEKNGYNLSLKFLLSSQDEGVVPVSFIHLGNRRFVIGKSDGRVQVRYIDHTRDFENPLDAQSFVLSEVSSHAVESGFDSNPVALCACEGWSSVTPGGHEYEFISIGGSDNKIKLWGLRSGPASSGIGENDFSSVYSVMGTEMLNDLGGNNSEYDSSLEVLGTFNVISEPPTKLTLKKHKKVWSGKAHACTFELQSRKNSPEFVIPIRRRVVMCFGGMLAFIEAYHIYHETFRFRDRRANKRLCAFNQGPPLSLVAQDDPRGHFKNSLLVLDSDDIISVINPSDGQLLRQHDCLYVADKTKTSFNRIGEDNSFYTEMTAHEGKPSCVYWDSVRRAILVGYSNGGVNYVGSDHARDLRTVDVFSAHDSAIRKMYVFLNSSKPGVTTTYLLVGDAKGKLSIWQISGPPKFQRLIWGTEAHTGAIVYANGLLTNGDHLVDASTTTANKMIVTACEAGVVKVWMQHDSGELMLSSFFKTRHGNISSFHPTFVVFSPDDSNKGELGESSDTAGSKTVQSALMRSIDGSATESLEKRVTKTMAHLICICGLQNGMVECWVLSNSDDGIGNNSYVLDSRSAIPTIPIQVPQWILPVHEAPIVSIMRLRNTYEDLLHSGNHVYLAMSGEGSAILMHMTVNGELIKQSGYFSLPSQVLCLLPCSEHGDRQYDEFYACCEQQIMEFSATATDNILSTRWALLRRDEDPTPPSNTENKESTVVPPSDSQDSQDSQDMGSVDHSEDMSEQGISESKAEPLNSSIESAYRDGSLLSDAGNGTIFADSMASMDNPIAADLHFAKKDSRLIQLFQQSVKVSGNRVSSDVLLEIILKWLNVDDEQVMKPETVWETMLLLGIGHEDKLPFIKVAKVAALCSKISKRRLKEDLGKLGMSDMQRSSLGSYRNMRKRKNQVVFNQLGEASVESLDFVDSVASGLARGDCVAYHESWKSQGSRVLDHTLLSSSSHQDQTHTRLRRIPAYFANHFKSKFLTRVELPTSWNSNNPHWLDQRRAIRITRSLLDMRCARQHELVFNIAQGNGSATNVESLSRLTCVYFERLFGHARLNVSHFKIVHYLEACNQYMACPVINLMQMFLCPATPEEEPSDLTLWMYVELRYFLMSNGLMIDGPTVAANDVAGFVGINGTTGPQEGGQLRWQLVSRDNAKLAIDEMFRKRGRFGHECVNRLMDSIDTIASVDLNQSIDIEGVDIIDMEGFLYMVAYEFHKTEHLIKELEGILFSLRQYPPFRVTTSRDIFHELPEKVSVNIPARNANINLSLDRIKSLLYQFVHNDPRRTGTLDQLSFRSVIVVAGQAILGFDQGRDAHKLVDESVRLFRDPDAPDSRICYADLIGQLIAYLVMQQGGTCGLGGSEALAALEDLAASGIGISEKQASAMVMMIQLMQCPPDTYPFWTTGVKGDEDQEQMQKSISKVGMWSVKEKNLPLDQSLSIQSVVEGEASVAGESLNTPVFPGMEVKQMKLKNALESMSLAEEELKKSFIVFDEEIDKGANQKLGSRTKLKVPRKEPALITQSEILLDNIEPLSAKEGGHNPVADNSYSKTIQKVSLSKPTASVVPPMALDVNAMAMHETYTGSVQPSSFQGSQVQKSHSIKTMASTAVNQTRTTPEKLAVEEVDMMRSTQADEEQEVMRMLEIEQERFARKRQAKESHTAATKAEARAKERKSMRFKAREDRLRYERVAAGKASYAEALRLQQEDVNKKYAAIIKRQEEERERVRLIKEKKRALENVAREKEREVQECILMRAADKFSADLEAFLKAKEEEERKKREAEELQREKEAAAKREKERIAEEARAAAAAKKAAKEAAEAAEREEENRRSEEKLFKAEDFNILSIPTEEELAAAAAAAAEAAEAEAAAAAAEAAAERERQEEEDAASTASRASSRAKSRSSARARTPGTPAGTALGEDEEEDYDETGSQSERELSTVEQRMIYFLERMKVAKDRNADHPRKSDDKKQYFMPMLFSDDIKYKNFEAPINDLEQRLGKWKPTDVGMKHSKEPNSVNFDAMEAANNSLFSDISEAVKEHKVKLVQDRLKRLYRTSSTEESPADWTEVIKKDAVAWVEFLDAQEAILMEKPPTPPPPVDEEAEFFKELKMNALFLRDVEEYEEEMSIPDEIPRSLPVPSDIAIKNISPLPLGHVARGILQPYSYAYFQIEVLDLSDLTVEVKSIRGYCDLYLSKSELPTKFNYQHRVHGGDYNNRIARLVYKPKEIGTHFLGVHTEKGAKFEAWSFASGAGAAAVQPLKRVSDKLRQWEIVSNHTVEEIDMKLPELMDEAKKIVAFENSMAMPSILSDYKRNEARQVEKLQGDDEESDVDEVDIMDTFISKAGRRLIRKDLHAGACSVAKKDSESDDESSDEEPDHIDPNAHPELFKKPQLKSRREYMHIVRAEPKLGASDINNFLNASMSDRSKSLSISQSLTSLPDLKKSLRARSLGSKSQSRTNIIFQDAKPSVVKLPPAMTKKIAKVEYVISDRVKETRGDMARKARKENRKTG